MIHIAIFVPKLPIYRIIANNHCHVLPHQATCANWEFVCCLIICCLVWAACLFLWAGCEVIMMLMMQNDDDTNLD